MSIPVMMTIAGSDCSAGAGLQADLKAAHAMGAFALTAVTCVVSEAPGTVRGIQEVDPALVADQVRINLEHFPVRAVKTGMLYSPVIVRAVHEVLAGADVPVVVDPVMIATAGDRLMREEAVAVYEELLLPGAALLTPNLDEAAVLLRSSVNPGRDELPEAAARLAVRYGCPVLLKGGHLEGDCRDVLSGPDGCLLGQWERPRVQDVSTHGTGCSLSAAVAARLAAVFLSRTDWGTRGLPPPFCALITLCACVREVGLVVVSTPMCHMELVRISKYHSNHHYGTANPQSHQAPQTY